MESSREFTVHDEMFVMRIGSQETTLSRYADNGDTHTLIFTFPAQMVNQASVGQPVTIQYGQAPSDKDWNFGTLPPISR